MQIISSHDLVLKVKPQQNLNYNIKWFVSASTKQQFAHVLLPALVILQDHTD
jgi:hypothetical protein